MNSTRPNWAHVSPITVETRPPARACVDFCKNNPGFLNNLNWGRGTINSVTDIFRIAPVLLILYIPRTSTVDGDAQSSDELTYRPIRSTTGVLLWSKPNSRPTNGFPSLNFTNVYPVCSGHGDRMGNGRTRAFTATQGAQVQSKEL
jgi:hypothetical protein